MKTLEELFKSGEVHSLAELDVFFENNKQTIKDICTPLDFISGVGIRVSTAVVVCREGGDMYLYKRTPPSSSDLKLRGTPGKFDTPKGVVPFVGPGKWYADESLVTGNVLGMTMAHEYSPSGQFAEFVLMLIIVFIADEAGEKHLESIINKPHEKLVGLERYEWVSPLQITEENAMTKVIAAAEFLKKFASEA